MKPPFHALIKLPALIVLLAISLTSCNTAVLPGGGGIGGTGIISGRVDGFGSIVIEDHRFETDNAIFEVNGHEARIIDIHIGMMVTAQVDFETMQASRVFYQPIVAGPIESYSAETGMLKVLQQDLQIDENTVLDSLTPAGLIPGLVVEVSGVRNSNNEVIANYISVSNDQSSRYLVGRIEDAEETTNRALVSGTILGYRRLRNRLNLTNEQYAKKYLRRRALVRAELPTDYLTAQCDTQSNEIVQPATDESLSSNDWLERTDCSQINDVTDVSDINLTPDQRAKLYGVVVAIPSANTIIVNNIEVTINYDTTIQSESGELFADEIFELNDIVVVNGKAKNQYQLHGKHITIINK